MKLCSLASIALLAALSQNAYAGTLTPAQFTLEFLMETQTETLYYKALIVMNLRRTSSSPPCFFQELEKEGFIERPWQ